MIRYGILLLIFLTSWALSAQEDLKSGVLIETGGNQGIAHIDTLGDEYNYRYNTFVITNDTTLPIQIHIAVSNEYDFPASCEGASTYKLFLLPKELTPDTITLYNNIFEGLHPFLDTCLNNPSSINKILEPGEQHVITIGTLTPDPPTCGVFPTMLFARENGFLYGTTWGSILIPCGHISYFKR